MVICALRPAPPSEAPQKRCFGAPFSAKTWPHSAPTIPCIAVNTPLIAISMGCFRPTQAQPSPENARATLKRRPADVAIFRQFSFLPNSAQRICPTARHAAPARTHTRHPGPPRDGSHRPWQPCSSPNTAATTAPKRPADGCPGRRPQSPSVSLTSPHGSMPAQAWNRNVYRKILINICLPKHSPFNTD